MRSFKNVGSFDTAGSFDSCKSTNINKTKANYFIEREVNAYSENDESDHIHGYVNSQDELILKLSSCDETITCLEDTIYQHLKDMQSMQKEMTYLKWITITNGIVMRELQEL